MRVERLELRVEVDRLVDRVDEAVQALAGAHVGAVGDDPQLVVGCEPVENDAAIDLVVPGRGIDRLVVENDLVHRRGDDVDERAGARLRAAEPSHRGGPKSRFAGRSDPVREVELHVVRRHIQEPGALARLVAGQVVRRHQRTFSAKSLVIASAGSECFTDGTSRPTEGLARPWAPSSTSGSIRSAPGHGSRRDGCSRRPRSATSIRDGTS